MQKTQADSEHSWTLDVSTLGPDCDLSVKNPNKVEVVDERTPAEILDELVALNTESKTLLDDITKMVKP